MHGMRSQIPGKEMISAKIHKSEKEMLLAACDTELIGKTLNLNNGAEVKILKNFYEDKKVTEEELIRLAAECTSANFFGTKTITALINAGIISKDSIMTINGVPHIQLYKI